MRNYLQQITDHIMSHNEKLKFFFMFHLVLLASYSKA